MLNKRMLMVIVSVLMIGSVIGGTGIAAAAPPEQENDTRTITVTGYGVAYGSPDIARVGLGVESVNSDITLAMDDTTNRMNAVIAALSDAGVATQDIRTEYFSIYQDYGYGGFAPGPDGSSMASDAQFRVSTSVTITIRDTTRVSKLIALAVDSGANMVNYTEFNIEDQAGLQANARQLAVADAQDRAAQLASILGASVGEPLNVVEGSDFYGPMSGFGGGGGGGGFAEAALPPISQGQLSVSMAVTITFALAPAN